MGGGQGEDVRGRFRPRSVTDAQHWRCRRRPVRPAASYGKRAGRNFQVLPMLTMNRQASAPKAISPGTRGAGSIFSQITTIRNRITARDITASAVHTSAGVEPAPVSVAAAVLAPGVAAAGVPRALSVVAVVVQAARTRAMIAAVAALKVVFRAWRRLWSWAGMGFSLDGVGRVSVACCHGARPGRPSGRLPRGCRAAGCRTGRGR